MTQERRTRTRKLIVHCTATRPGTDWGFDEIDALHKRKGWSGCGYHAIVRLDARLEAGRHPDAIGAHCYGLNAQSYGVVLVGGLDQNGKASPTYSQAMLQTLRIHLEDRLNAYPGAAVEGHRDQSPDLDGDGIIERWEWLKECPCFDVRHWWLTGQVRP